MPSGQKKTPKISQSWFSSWAGRARRRRSGQLRGIRYAFGVDTEPAFDCPDSLRAVVSHAHALNACLQMLMGVSMSGSMHAWCCAHATVRTHFFSIHCVLRTLPRNMRIRWKMAKGLRSLPMHQRSLLPNHSLLLNRQVSLYRRIGTQISWKWHMRTGCSRPRSPL